MRESEWEWDSETLSLKQRQMWYLWIYLIDSKFFTMSDVRFRTKDPDHDGWLFKWTNYIKGYQRRWFVLKDGVLSYYRWDCDCDCDCICIYLASCISTNNTNAMAVCSLFNRNPADVSHTCRGSIKITNALIHTEESCNFLVSNGGTQTFHLRAASEIERYAVYLLLNSPWTVDWSMYHHCYLYSLSLSPSQPEVGHCTRISEITNRRLWRWRWLLWAWS